MTQEVRVMLQLTLEADASLSVGEIKELIRKKFDFKGKLQLIMSDFIEVREEAEIYGNNEESPEMQEYYKKYHIDKKRQTKLDL